MKPSFITDLDWKLLKQKYEENMDEVLQKLNENYPVQYLIGNVEFLNTVINVDERVLIPRYETELLTDKTLKKVKKLQLNNPKILELGTGSGCISIALRKNLQCQITAVDISKQALDLAKENAQLNKVDIHFENQDMLDISYENYDVLISNPPYVSKAELVGMETKYEPQNAIFADNEGLYFYEEILKKLYQTKSKPIIIAFEIGYQQGETLKNLAQKYLSTYTCEIEKDLANKDRYAFLTKIE